MKQRVSVLKRNKIDKHVAKLINIQRRHKLIILQIKRGYYNRYH